MAEPFIRPIRKEDVKQIHEIEKACFAMPWSEESILHDVKENVVARWLVLDDGNGGVLAYAGMWFVLDEAHVCNVAVRPDSRGLGYGKRIFTALIDLAMENSMACLQCAYGLLMASAQTHWELKMARYRYDARQRYLWFLSAYPGLIQKVSNKYVASFLGMNPSTLSRQKAALRNEKREKQREKSGTDDPQLFSAVFDPTKG